jgi:hypothetical protein
MGSVRDFASFLDEFVDPSAKPVEQDEGAGDDAQAAPSIPFGFVGAGDAGTLGGVAGEGLGVAYLGLNAQWATPDPLPETATDAIARELALHRITDMKSLDRLRREFAFRNHPDRVRTEWRERSMARMQVANRLIDEAKQRLAARKA